MKRKISSIFLFVAMLLAVCGIAILIIFNTDALLSVFKDTESQLTPLAYQTYISIAILLTCLVIMFVILIKETGNGAASEYGKVDALTGLCNKTGLRAKYKKLILDYTNYFCMAYIGFDVDRVLKKFSRSVCDQLQKEIADALSSECDNNDCVSRVGDGAFCLILSCKDGLYAQKRVNGLLEELQKCQYRILLEELIRFKAGVYLPETEKPDFDTAFDDAKLAYRYACVNNSDVMVYTYDLLEKEEQKNRIYGKLSHAIDNKEFEMYLQFVHDVKAERFVGAEALSRWNSPDEGLIMPAYYIEDMRTTGIIEKFDMYMLDKTCELLEKWSGEDQFDQLTISCNITRITISSEDFLSNFRKIVNKYKFNHHFLILEITEDALIDNRAIAYKNIIECKSDGFQIALDDFGAGNSSFSDINNYPVDLIKVDRQFISTSLTKRGETLLTGMIDMAHQLSISVVCEGVETKKQRDIVSGSGCDYIQGYYYSYVFSVEEGKKHYLDSLCDKVR